MQIVSLTCCGKFWHEWSWVMSHEWFVYVSFLGSWRSWDSVCCRPWRLGTGLADQVIESRYIRYDVCVLFKHFEVTPKKTGMRKLMLYEPQSNVFWIVLTFHCLQPNYRCFRLATLPGCWKRLVLRIMESWCTRARITSLFTEARWNLVDSGCECHDAGYAVGYAGYSDIL